MHRTLLSEPESDVLYHVTSTQSLPCKYVAANMSPKRKKAKSGAQAAPRTPTRGELARKLAGDILSDIQEFRINVQVSYCLSRQLSRILH